MDLFRATKRFRRGLAAFLLVAWLHLLGACPCGCLEHNYWFRMLGLVGNIWDFPGSDDFNVAANRHDCIHKPHDSALAEEKLCEGKTPERMLVVAIADMEAARSGLALPATSAEHAARPLALSSASAQRAMLQVFTL